MYRITECLSVGPFASPERAKDLLAAGVTHILNVSDEPSEVFKSDGGFKEVAWVPMCDFKQLPHPLALQALDTLHRMVTEAEAHVYVHCIAGAIRSPTIIWMHLIA